MNTAYPNAWDFSNTTPNLVAPNGKHRIEYEHLYEIAMGAPLCGLCFLVLENHTRIKISDCAGGPPIWNAESTQVCFPVWTKHREQQIVLVNLSLNTVVTFAKLFRVLEIKLFTEGILKGLDSPLYKSEDIMFNINKESIQEERLLQQLV